MKTRPLISGSVILAILFSMSCAVDASLIVNGNFEDGGSGYFSGGSSFAGWTVLGAATKTVWVGADNALWDGQGKFLDLTGGTGGSGVRSDPFATTDGQLYQVTFQAKNYSASYPGTLYSGPAISLQASGASREDYSSISEAGQDYTYLFMAKGPSTTLSFMELANTDNNASWIDNVRVTAVPEPSTYLAGLSALGILGWFGRRNRR